MLNVTRHGGCCFCWFCAPTQVVGNFIEFGKDQCGFILNMYHKYGPCYTMGMMGQNLTFLVGPDVSAAFSRLRTMS